MKNLIFVTITFCGYEEYKVIFSDLREPLDKLDDRGCGCFPLSYSLLLYIGAVIANTGFPILF